MQIRVAAIAVGTVIITGLGLTAASARQKAAAAPGMVVYKSPT